MKREYEESLSEVVKKSKIELLEDEEIPGTKEIQDIITHELHDKLEGHFLKLKEVLKDDKEFFKELTEQLLLVGKGIYHENIKEMIWDQYWQTKENCKIMEEKEKYSNLIDDLKTITLDIVRLLNGNDEIEVKIEQLAEEDQDEVWSIIRSEIEEEMYNIVKYLDHCDV